MPRVTLTFEPEEVQEVRLALAAQAMYAALVEVEAALRAARKEYKTKEEALEDIQATVARAMACVESA